MVQPQFLGCVLRMQANPKSIRDCGYLIIRIDTDLTPSLSPSRGEDMGEGA